MNIQTLQNFCVSEENAKTLLKTIENIFSNVASASERWEKTSAYLIQTNCPFDIHLLFFKEIYPNWHSDPSSAPAWLPGPQELLQSNLAKLMHAQGFSEVPRFHEWSYREHKKFWQLMVDKLSVPFIKKPKSIVDLTQGFEAPNWFPEGELNIAQACFQTHAQDIALTYLSSDNQLEQMTYDELDRLSNRVANGLVHAGFKVGDKIAIIMAMDHHAIGIYLGIIKMGGVVVSIADSFSAIEIQTRLKISQTKFAFTQDANLWSGKLVLIQEKVETACNALNIPRVILPTNGIENKKTVENISWQTFLSNNDHFTPVAMPPMSACHVLFSSGTTAEPKAIIWDHTTPIKAASDACLHQNIQPRDMLAWPTSLGWMMGPWLVFAALINKASIALYTDSPKERAFGEFVGRAKVTLLGVVPTLVAAWRESHCMQGLDWSRIKLFSSTGECSNAEDMLYLMSLAGYRPVIEYCGGTEIGGAYLSSTVLQPNCPALFSTPTMGMQFVILDENGALSDKGDVAIVPPSIGLSTELLNANHHEIYYANMPQENLRRHGDQIERLAHNYYAVLGRSDDSMNLSGIKISAAEIERAITGISGILEIAAIGYNPPGHHQTQLIIFACTVKENLDEQMIQKEMQQKIKNNLNPLFKIHEVVLVNELPKTASNKIMRRVLRRRYQEGIKS